jgi:hypothetical protein
VIFKGVHEWIDEFWECALLWRLLGVVRFDLKHHLVSLMLVVVSFKL